ncbi:MAG: SDR family oxidoreductase, partial [Burkholderiaceae bacterium]
MKPSTKQSKVIVLTGASSGIGEATAHLLAAQGHRLVLGARRTERLQSLCQALQSQGFQAAYQAVDVTRLEDVQRMVAFAEQTYGPVDVIVNNAGIMPLSPMNAIKVQEWNSMIDVNIRGVLHGIAAVLPGMEARG